MKGLEKKELLFLMCRLILTGIGTAAVCMLLFLLTLLIPTSKIQDNCAKSSVYYENREMFPYLVEGQFNTRQDNYADCIQTNIMHYMNSEKDSNLFWDMVKASYYDEKGKDEKESFREAMSGGRETNVDYFRYWHGSLVFLRPLFLVTDIAGARMVLGLTALFFLLAVFFALWKKGYHAGAVSFLIAAVSLNVWMILFCIEYVMPFLVMGVASLFVVLGFQKAEAWKKRKKRLLTICVISGVCCCFFDFLTAETITITVPLLLELMMERENEEKTTDFWFIIKAGTAWVISYGAMFLLKWILAVMVLGKDAFLQAVKAAEVRISGTVYMGDTNLTPEADFIERITGVLSRNQGMLFPFREQMSQGLAVFLFLLVVCIGLACIYLFRKKNFALSEVGLFAFLGILPYLRYLVLNNHAYIHYFFTYRAQYVSIMVLAYLVWEKGIKNVWRRK